MPPTRRAPEALCPRAVRPSHTGISYAQYLKNPLVDFYHTWPWDATWGVDELIRFWVRSTQGQRSHVNKLGLNMPFLARNHEISISPWWIFSQTWHRGVPWGVNELIRTWMRYAQRQRSKVNELGLNMLLLVLPRKHDISQEPLGGFFIKLAQGCIMTSRSAD